jgi:hypothetical protein
VNKKQIFAISSFLIIAAIGVFSRRIPPVWLSLLYIPYSLLALYVAYRLFPQDDKTNFVNYIKKVHKFPQGIILLVMDIAVILLLLSM